MTEDPRIQKLRDFLYSLKLSHGTVKTIIWEARRIFDIE